MIIPLRGHANTDLKVAYTASLLFLILLVSRSRRCDPQTSGSGFEVFDANLGADLAIGHVFYQLERSQRCHLSWLGDEVWDACSVNCRIQSGCCSNELAVCIADV